MMQFCGITTLQRSSAEEALTSFCSSGCQDDRATQQTFHAISRALF